MVTNDNRPRNEHVHSFSGALRLYVVTKLVFECAMPPGLENEHSCSFSGLASGLLP
jgi:hypothetical protein